VGIVAGVGHVELDLHVLERTPVALPSLRLAPTAVGHVLFQHQLHVLDRVHLGGALGAGCAVEQLAVKSYPNDSRGHRDLLVKFLLRRPSVWAGGVLPF